MAANLARGHELAVRRRCRHPSGVFFPFPREALEGSIPGRFAAIATAWPDRPAVVSPAASLTYRELAGAAAGVTRAVLAQREHRRPVALLFGHDVHIFSAILGVLGSGRPYLPLDVDQPAERLAYMIEDSGASLLISERRHAAKLDDIGIDNGLFIDDLDAGPAVDDDAPAVGPDSAAFVIYTSGSTGRPKGFVQTHVNILHDTMHYTNSGRFSINDRFLLVAPFSFAGAVRTIFSSLLNGACLYPFAVKQYGLEALKDWIGRHEITIYRSVPTLFRSLAGVLAEGAGFPRLRLIYLGGEPVYASDFALYRDHFSDGCILVNRLGTGEALTFCCYFMDKNTRIRGSNVPVGYEVEDKKVVLLDDQGRVLPRPGRGEIAVSSRYLSPGYLRDPRLNEKAFSVDPSEPGRRLYRTGDLGELSDDGCLVHLGRRDFQVMVRGHRVEPGEIETALMERDDVRQAVVTSYRGERSAVDLVAYVTAQNHAKLSTSELAAYARARLPQYMIPARFVVLPEMPLTRTGKVDRKALPDVPRERPELDNPVAAFRTDTESQLVKIWEQTLAVEPVGIHDDFLCLGGDSITAMQIIVRVSEAFGTSLSMHQVLLKASTVAEMAAVVEQARETGPQSAGSTAAS